MIRTRVEVICDGCGCFEEGHAPRASGWLTWSDDDHWMHLCPACATDPKQRGRLQTRGVTIP